MSTIDYWLEVIQQSAEEHGVTMTDEQAKAMAADVETSHDNYGMAFYAPPQSELPIFAEAKELKRQLEQERDAQWCPECQGKGRIWTQGPHHGSDTQCWKCNGKGKVYRP